jgi:autotransporter-associated beta strand protein
MIAVCAVLFSVAAYGNTLSWSGGSSVSGNWSDSANWGGAGTPADGDTIIFGAIATSRLATTNNLTSLVLNQIRFNGSSGGFAVYGNAFTLTNSIMATNITGANTINNNFTIATADVTLLVSNSATLTLNGQVNGTVGITKTGGGTLLYQNSSGSNPYSGTTRVNAGTLQLNVSGTAAFGGPLIVGDGSGTAATVRHLQSTEISDVLPITINLGGLLDLNGFSELISTSLALNSGSISTGTGTLTLSPNATITLSTVSAVPTINGNLNVGSSGTCTIQGSGYLNINAVVSGAANIVKNGSVNVFLDNANTFTGSFTANGSGYVEIATPTALGTTNGGTVINGSVQLVIDGGVNVINENLTMNSSYANGAIWLDTASAVSSWTATNITLSAATTISVANSSTLTLIGPISGPGGVTKTGPGTLTYSGDNGNAYTGPTVVNNGLLQLGNTQGGIPYGSLTITNATVRDLNDYGLNGGQVPITVQRGGLFDLNGHIDEFANSLTLSGGGTVNLGSGGTLQMLGVPTAITNLSGNGAINGSGYLQLNAYPCTIYVADGFSLDVFPNVAGPAAITKTGAGTLNFRSANSYAGLTTISQGYLWVYNPLSLGTTTSGTVVSSGATLVLAGSIGITNESLTLNGPGAASDYGALDVEDSPGTNIWAGPITLNANSTFDPWYANSGLRIIGPISGAGGVIELTGSSGTLSLEGTTANTYAGTTTVNSGTLLLGKPFNTRAVAGPLVIGDGTDASTVRCINGQQIWSILVPTTINNLGLLDLNGNTDAIGALTIQGGGQITTGSGQIYLYTPITVEPGPSIATISGRASLNSAPNPLVINTAGHQYSPDLRITANLSGPSGIGLTKSGYGEVSLAASNSFSGPVVVNYGNLWVENSYALGNSANTVTVSSGGALYLSGSLAVGTNLLVLNGSGPGSALALGCLWANNGSSSLAGNVTLATSSTLDVETNGAPFAALTLTGVISGAGGLTKTGLGTLNLFGTSGNTYAGNTFIQAGTNVLDKSSGVAIPAGTLTIGDNLGSSAVVRDVNFGGNIYQTVSLRVNNRSLLDLNGYSEMLGLITLDGGNIQTGAGFLTMNGDMISTNSTGTNQMSIVDGSLALGAANRTFSAYNDFWINAGVSGAGGIIKNGNQYLYLAASNSYAGLTVVQSGWLVVMNSWALGTTNSGTVVSNGATLMLDDGGNPDDFEYYGIYVSNESLVLNGSGVNGTSGALESVTYGNDSWTGPITLNTDSTIVPYNGDLEYISYLHILGPISGPGGLTQAGSGYLLFEGNATNTYAGTTTVSPGDWFDGATLVLNRSSSDAAVPGNLVINSAKTVGFPCTVQLWTSHQIANSADVLINTNALLDCGTAGDDINTLRGSGTVNMGTNGYLEVGINNGTSTFDGTMTGTGIVGGWALGKFGTGTFTLTGTNSCTGYTYAQAGTLIINGNQPQVPVYVTSGATLGGTGAVGIVAAYGIISPGASPGILNTSNVTFSASGNLTVQLTGLTPGNSYDQLNVTGTVSLASAALTVVPAFATPVSIGQQFTIINNDLSDAITGTFSGLAEGATNTAGNYQFTISYVGGTGNDVVLTLAAIPCAVAGATVTSGDGNHGMDPNDCNNLSLVITNLTGTMMSTNSATLSTTTEGVLITQPYATYPNIPAHSSGVNLAPFQISTLPSFVCGTPIYLQLIVKSGLGSFTINFVLQSGEPSGAPNRYDNSVATSIPDVGSIDSTNTVSGFVGPIMKVAVSLYLTHTYDQDLTNISLIGPDGTTVMLSAANGGSGQNYGSGTNDASRTTFDDAAATSITSGTAPFVGTFRPQSPLSAFIGSASNGNWRLHIADGYGGSLGTLRTWSLFLYPVACGSGGGACDLCMPAITNAITTSDPVQTGRWAGNLVVASCGTPKTWPGTVAGSYHFDEYSFTNTSPADACVTVELQSPSNILVTAYLRFDPANITSNYLGDAGNSTHGGQTTFSCTVPAGASFLVVVTEVIANAGTQPYTLQLSGLPCPPPTVSIQSVPANKARLYWPTWAGGYLLESESNLLSGAWATITNEPIVGNHQYNVTNSINTSIDRFYRLHKP